MKHKGFTLIGLMIVVAIVTTAGSATADAYYKGEPWRSGDMGNATACYDMYGKDGRLAKTPPHSGSNQPLQSPLILTASAFISANLCRPSHLAFST